MTLFLRLQPSQLSHEGPQLTCPCAGKWAKGASVWLLCGFCVAWLLAWWLRLRLLCWPLGGVAGRGRVLLGSPAGRLCSGCPPPQRPLLCSALLCCPLWESNPRLSAWVLSCRVRGCEGALRALLRQSVGVGLTHSTAVRLRCQGRRRVGFPLALLACGAARLLQGRAGRGGLPLGVRPQRGFRSAFSSALPRYCLSIVLSGAPGLRNPFLDHPPGRVSALCSIRSQWACVA